MSKGKKIDVKNVYLKEENGKLVIRGFEGEEIPFENLSEEMSTLIKQDKPLDIKMKPHSSRKPSERAPIYKYICPKCQTEIKSKKEELQAKCIECDCNFELVED